jgi:hypothetical protein
MSSELLTIVIRDHILDLVSSQGELHFHDIVQALRLDPQQAQRALAQLIRSGQLNVRLVDGLRRFRLPPYARRKVHPASTPVPEGPGWSHLM